MRRRTVAFSVPVCFAVIGFASPVALVFLALLTGRAVAHPYHVSISEIEHDAFARRLEVAVRVHAEDLEAALSRRAGHRVVLETTGDVDERIATYLGEVVCFEDPEAGDGVADLTWVGKEIDVGTVWLYFEVDLPVGARSMAVSNRLFFEIQPDQTNTINLVGGAAARFEPEEGGHDSAEAREGQGAGAGVAGRTARFTRESPRAVLVLGAEASVSPPASRAGEGASSSSAPEVLVVGVELLLCRALPLLAILLPLWYLLP